jgi:hypothetical protein
MAKVAAGLRTVYDAPALEAAGLRLHEFEAEYTPLYPAAVASIREAWAGISPFFDLPCEIRRMIYSTNMIESFNARVRSAVTRHGHFPNKLTARNSNIKAKPEVLPVREPFEHETAHTVTDPLIRPHHGSDRPARRSARPSRAQCPANWLMVPVLGAGRPGVGSWRRWRGAPG